MVMITNITKMFGIKHPIVGAPMGPWTTDSIAIGICEAGGLGIVSHIGMVKTWEEFEEFSKDLSNLGKIDNLAAMQESLIYVAEHTDKPFGFNIRTSRNETDAGKIARELPKFIMENPKLKDQVLYALTSAGSPRILPQSKSFQRLREVSEIKHFHVAPALWLADKCIASGVDGLVCTGGEGGGHQSYEQVSTLVLLQQIRQKYPDVPLLACGGIASGEGLAAVLAMGGGGIVMGTQFISSKECEFHDNWKNVIPPAKAGDTKLVTGRLGPIRLWKNKYCISHNLVSSKEELVDYEEERTPEAFMEELKHYMAVYKGDVENTAILMGQSAGIINSIESIRDIVKRIVTDAEKCLNNAYATIK
jgi:enoyl-[acyl-carrier protein] reductase II